jgi:hypothetical protein
VTGSELVALDGDHRQPNHLVRLRPRDDTIWVAQGRTVLATGRDGFITSGSEHGLFVHETRMISRYFLRIDGEAPKLVAQSNVEQHSWMGYYVRGMPGIVVPDPDAGSGLVDPSSEQTLECRLSRYAGHGLHEDVDLSNFSLKETTFELELEVDADFADQVEVHGQRQQQGHLHREWRPSGRGKWELIFN